MAKVVLRLRNATVLMGLTCFWIFNARLSLKFWWAQSCWDWNLALANSVPTTLAVSKILANIGRGSLERVLRKDAPLRWISTRPILWVSVANNR